MDSMKASADKVRAELQAELELPGIDSRFVTDDQVRMCILVARIEELEELGVENGKL